ncbi:suppressor of fused domain protein [Actinokineospora sp. NPDC004072]
MTDLDEAPGWDAIDAALADLYPGVAPRHVGYPPGVHLGSGLQGCSAYPTDEFWHYVSYGLTELWGKDAGSDPQWSGWGFELTMRVRRHPGQDLAPGWPFSLLEHLARFVREQRVLLAGGHVVDLRQPLTDGTALTAVAFAADPELGSMETVNGRVDFLTAVGITAAELAALHEGTWSLADLADPMLLTDPARAAS